MTLEQKINQMTIEELRKELLKAQMPRKQYGKRPIVRELPRNDNKRARMLAGSVGIEQWGKIPHPDQKKLDPVMAEKIELCQHVWTRDSKRQPEIQGNQIMIPTRCKMCAQLGTKWVEARVRR